MSLTDELPKHVLTPGIKIKHHEREEIERHTAEFLKNKKNKITELPDGATTEAILDGVKGGVPICLHRTKKLPPTFPGKGAGR